MCNGAHGLVGCNTNLRGWFSQVASQDVHKCMNLLAFVSVQLGMDQARHMHTHPHLSPLNWRLGIQRVCKGALLQGAPARQGNIVGPRFKSRKRMYFYLGVQNG